MLNYALLTLVLLINWAYVWICMKHVYYFVYFCMEVTEGNCKNWTNSKLSVAHTVRNVWLGCIKDRQFGKMCCGNQTLRAFLEHFLGPSLKRQANVYMVRRSRIYVLFPHHNHNEESTSSLNWWAELMSWAKKNLKIYALYLHIIVSHYVFLE